jgi:hypothetical protein
MLVSEITNSIRARLRERGSTSRFTDDALLDYLNDIRLETADEIQGERKKIDLNPDDNGRVYVPSDLLRIERVNVNLLELPALSPSYAGLDSGNNLGGSYGYIWIDGYIQLIPETTSPLSLQYISGLPAFLSVDQEIQIDEIYRMALVYGVLEQCFIELGDNTRGAYFNGKYEKEKRKRKRTMRQKAWRNSKGPFIPALER